jgi:Acetyltransferase (GNAT) domain
MAMITATQEEYIERQAYLPEHVPEYVTAISQTEAFLFGDYLAYAKQGHLILIGYPLEEPFEEKRMERALEDAVKRLSPESVSLMAPSIPASLENSGHPPTDHYYRLDLSSVNISQKLRNMLKRAGRELSVGKNPHFDQEHKKMVEEFLKSHSADEATRFIFQRIDTYLSSSKTASIFEARTGDGDLVAFDVAEFKPRDYAVYMFNFRSEFRYIPGASDLLLSSVMQQAIAEGKKYINLGLGINPGVAFFKEKWGGVVFLPHAFCLYHLPRKGLLEMLLQRL